MTRPTRALAEFVSSLRYEALADDVRRRVREIVLDTFASALAGHDAAESPRVQAVARSLAPGEETTVIGGPRLSPVAATMTNGYLITGVTVCDIHRPTMCHVTPEVVPPAIVAAERRGASGQEFLTAIAAGLEVTTRVGLGLHTPAYKERGWHSPGVTGPFGGAASAGRLLGLDADAQLDAFGLAGSQAAGTYAQLRTPAIKFQQSRGALGGLLAASFAADGFGAAEEVLGNPTGGLFAAYAEGGRPEAVVEGLGEDWELLRMSLRAWPVAVHLQPVVTGLLQCLADGTTADALTYARVSISPTAFRMHGEVPWDNRFRARLSAPYVTGVVLNDRRCWLTEFTPERIADAALNAFIRDKVTVAADAQVRDGTARIELGLAGGDAVTRVVDTPHGDPQDPLTEREIVAKFRAAAEPILSPAAIDRVVELLDGIEDVADMREVFDRLRPAAG